MYEKGMSLASFMYVLQKFFTIKLSEEDTTNAPKVEPSMGNPGFWGSLSAMVFNYLFISWRCLWVSKEEEENNVPHTNKL